MDIRALSPNLKVKAGRLSEVYLTALRIHLDLDSSPSLQAAHGLGVQAVAIGLETLNIASMHKAALATLIKPESTSATRNDLTRRAESFFTEVILPIEETHRIAMQASVQLSKLNKTLLHRTETLLQTRQQIKDQIEERESVEASLKMSTKNSAQLLKESLLLQEQLKHMAHKALSADEAERKKMSLQLQGEIAQTLLGIHVRLLLLKKEASANHMSLSKEIITTQQLVEDSVKTITGFAREFGIQK